MGSLAGKSPASTYKSLLKVTDETNGVTSSISVIQDGNGSDTCLSVSERSLKVNPSTDTPAMAIKFAGEDASAAYMKLEIFKIR